MHGHRKQGGPGHYAYASYECAVRKHTRTAECSASQLSVRAVEQAVTTALFRDVLTRHNLKPMADDLLHEMRQRQTTQTGQLDTVKAAIAAKEKVINALLDQLEDDELSDETKKTLRGRLNTRITEKNQLVGQKRQIEVSEDHTKALPVVDDALIDEWITTIHRAIAGDDMQNARHILATIVSKVVVKDRTGTLYYTFPVALLSGAQPNSPLWTPSPEGFRVRASDLHKS